jgi:hypothetical protein
MSEARGLNPKKRPHSEQNPSEPEGPSRNQKRKLDHSHLSEPSAAFRGSLSKIWLTKRALKELDRRNAQSARHTSLSRRKLRRPLTRRALAELKKSCPPFIPASTYLSDHCTAERLKEIRSSGRQGGPDLSDLRGVFISFRNLRSL